MTTILGGSTLREVGDIQISDEFEGEQTTAHDGSVILDYTNLSRTQYELSWKGLSLTERNTVRAGYDTAGSMTFTGPHMSASVAVMVKRGSWKETPWKDGNATLRFDVEMELTEID